MISKAKKLVILILLPALTLACGVFLPLERAVNPPSEVVQPTLQALMAPTSPPAKIELPAVTVDEEALLIELYRQGNIVIPEGQGSGFVYDADGHIVTNSHVVHGADALEVVFADNTTLEAELVGEDLHSDLAVIRVESLPEGVQPLPLGDINEVAVGQTVVAIGNPFGLGGTLTRGIVSALGRSIPALTAFSIPQAIQTDAPINPGNSGGPLLNLRGEVIGVNAQIETSDGVRANSGVGFAIPVSIVARVVPALIQDGKYEWAWMGVVGGTINPAMVKAMKLPTQKGAYISQVVNNGPAERAGLRGSNDTVVVDGRRTEIGGDVIVAIDGQPVTSFEDILIYIALNTRPGQQVTLTVLRNNQTREITLELQPRPANTREFLQP